MEQKEKKILLMDQMHVMVCQPAGCDSVNVSPLHPLPGGGGS